MKRTNRFIALALCCTLTLGAFAYRPPAAKAIAVVDDAVVIGALLTAFSAGCGLIFSNNGMTSSEIASAMTAKWNEYKETLSDTVSSFSAWLGYDDMDALITDLRWDQVTECLEIPRAVARKFADFTTWLVDNLGVTLGGETVEVSSGWGGWLYQVADGVSVSSSGNSLTLRWSGLKDNSYAKFRLRIDEIDWCSGRAEIATAGREK